MENNRKKFPENGENPFEKNQRLRNEIVHKNDFDRDREIGSSGGSSIKNENKGQSIRRAFARKFPEIIENRQAYFAAADRVSELLEEGEADDWKTYERAGKEILSEMGIQMF